MHFERPTLLCILMVGCMDSAYVGSDIVWSADHETEDVSQWTADMAGHVVNDDGGVVEISDAYAHSGRHALLLSAPADPAPGALEGGAHIVRRGLMPSSAYYSAWYLIPEPYTTESYWSVMQFAVDDPEIASGLAAGVDLTLRSLPDGQLVLELFDHPQERLHTPIAYPPPIVPIGRWFLLEVHFRALAGESGSPLSVWLDGREVYRSDDQSTASPDVLLFVVCSVALRGTPRPLQLYVDDAAISLSRIGPSGALQ